MKSILTSLLLLTSLLSLSQIEVKETKAPVTVTIGRYKYSDFNKGALEYFINDNDTSIAITYYNQKYPTLKDQKFVLFKGGAKDVNQLYTIFSSFYSEENKAKESYQLEFKLGKTDVTLTKRKKLIDFSTKEGYFVINQDNVETMFGKRACVCK